MQNLLAEVKSTTDTIREGQIVRMKVVVKNTGTIAVNNAKAVVTKPEKATFMEYSDGNGFFELDGNTQTYDIAMLQLERQKRYITL